MYNDDQNLYHYSYTSGDQPGQSYDSRTGGNPYGGYQTPPAPEYNKPKKKRTGLKITALALCCALLGGAVGGGAAWFAMKNVKTTTQINTSARSSAEVVVNTVDGTKLMTDAEVYAANVNSVVSINTTILSTGTNIFGQTTESASAGSGFVLTKDGFIVTNYHVVKDANTIKVTLYDGTTYDATYIGGDEDYDIAVVKIDASDLQCVTLGDSQQLNVGDRVLAVGNPLGELTFSMSGGMVSCVNRTINVDGTPFNMIQTDASINPGNSGGPLFNQYGEVVGIVSAKYSSYASQSVEGLGFAIPINDVIAMIEDIMTNGYITNKPYLGITGGTMNEQMAAQYRYNITKGVFVYSVEEGGAADKAGLKLGDVITKIDNTDITSMEDLTKVKKQYSAGDTSTFTIYRDGASTTVEITWDAVPADQQTNTQETQNSQNSQNGTNPYSGGAYTNPYDIFNYFFGGGYR